MSTATLDTLRARDDTAHIEIQLVPNGRWQPLCRHSLDAWPNHVEVSWRTVTWCHKCNTNPSAEATQ